MTKPLIYLSAPLFNASERGFNLRLRERLLPFVDVYLPQLDGSLLADAVASGVPYRVAADQIFSADTSAINRCDALLIVLNGRSVDEGAAFELGVAWALDKPCVGFKDDARQLLASGDNPMIAQALDAVFCNLDEVGAWASSFPARERPSDLG